jgi:hypothetical protein
MFSDSTHVAKNSRISFFVKVECYFTVCVCVCVCVCVYLIFSLLIHLLMDSVVDSISWLLWIVLQWIWEYRHLLQKSISNLLGKFSKWNFSITW